MATMRFHVHLAGSALLIGTAVLRQAGSATATTFFTAFAALVAAIPC